MAKVTAFRPQILLFPRLYTLSFQHNKPKISFACSCPPHPCLGTTTVCSSWPNWSPVNAPRVASSVASEREEEGSGDEFVVINFYKFVSVENPQDEVTKQMEFLQGRDIHGRIYINEQGINAQYSGPRNDAIAYVEFLRQDPRFSDILIQISPALNGHAFPRLKLRYKSSLLQMEGGISHLPVLNPDMRATLLSPSEWKAKLQDSCPQKRVLLLDVRNGYEWDIGHFEGAERPNVDCFRSTSYGLSDEEVVDPNDPLTGVDKEKTDILMYCTGGIRCDVYSTVLRNKGFKNLYTLSGGVSNYLKSEGPNKWVGNLFVFDSRLALPPGRYQSHKNDAEIISSSQPENESIVALGKCYVCGSQLQEFRHRNCANLDCNLLFLCCASCLSDLRGCCSSDCTSAPRLRPVLPGHQLYDKWHVYRDGKVTREINA